MQKQSTHSLPYLTRYHGVYHLEGPQQSPSVSPLFLAEEADSRKATFAQGHTRQQTRCPGSWFTPFLFTSKSHLFASVHARYLTRTISPFSGSLPPAVLCARSLSCQPPARKRLSGLWLWIAISMFTATGVRSVVSAPSPCQAH